MVNPPWEFGNTVELNISSRSRWHGRAYARNFVPMSRKIYLTLVMSSLSFFQIIILRATFSNLFVRAVLEEDEGNQDRSLFDPVPHIYDWASVNANNDALLQAVEGNYFNHLSTEDSGLIKSNNDIPFQSIEEDNLNLFLDNGLFPLSSELTATSMYVHANHLI